MIELPGVLRRAMMRPKVLRQLPGRLRVSFPVARHAPDLTQKHNENLRRLATMTNRLIPRMVTLTTGDILDLEMQRAVRQELASLTALGRALGN